jgi:crossover junction endodeoxyribonuclease RuvC
MKRTYLGLDLSMSSAGIAVVITEDRKPLLKVAFRVKTNPKERHGQRLHKIAVGLRDVLREHAPFETIVREKGFSRFANTTQTLFKVVGVSDFILRDYGIVEISPTSVKKLVTGDGKADKQAVEDAVRKIMQIDDSYIFESDDASDAVAVVLAYLIENGLIDGV